MTAEEETMDELPAAAAGASGAGIRIGIVDSGVNPRHPAVVPVVAGVGLRWRGSGGGGAGYDGRDGRVERDDDSLDRIGHGTAVAAAIRAGAPRAEIVPIRVFRRTLTTRVATLVAALDWAAEQHFDLVNLSLGVGEGAWRSELEAACRRVARAGALLVAASERDGAPSLPGAFESVIGVRADPRLERNACRFEAGRLVASLWGADLPELPREANLHGSSLAVANATAWLARAMEALGRRSLRVCLQGKGVLYGGAPGSGWS